jgi:hypothetical protein
MLAACAIALALAHGKDLDWDLLNYHYYNGWALLHDRLDRDIAAAQLQTYFNPLLDAGGYLAIAHLPPWLVASLYALVQSANAGLLFLLARRLLRERIAAEDVRTWVALALALAGMTGAIFRAEIGGGVGDTLVSIPLLGSVALVVCRHHRQHTLRVLFVAGALAGCAAGLKLVAAIHAAGFGLAIWVLPAPSAWRRCLQTGVFGAGALLGWAALDGWWRLHLWQEFGNPFFPLFNQWFRSPYATLAPLADTRFLPHGLGQALIYPLYWLVHPAAVSDAGRFLDLRLPLWFVVGLLWIARRQWGGRRRPLEAGSAFLLSGSTLSYLLWLTVFGVYRYLATLELLAPLALTLLLGDLVRAPRARRVGFAALLALLVVLVLPMKYARGDLSGDYFGIALPPSAQQATQGLVLLGGVSPIAFVVPALSEALDFVRVSSNFHGAGERTRLDEDIERRVATATGPLYAMIASHEAAAFDARLAQLGVARAPGSCAPIGNSAHATRPVPMLDSPLLWCRVEQARPDVVRP